MSKIKQEFHQLIDEMDDDKLLNTFFEMFKSNSTKDEKGELSVRDQAILLESIAQAKRGEVITYVELKKRVDQWFGR